MENETEAVEIIEYEYIRNGNIRVVAERGQFAIAAVIS